MRKLLILMAALLIPINAFALMPPMTEEELKTESNTIVKGQITKVECTGKSKDKGCVKLTGYKATLKVNGVVKGSKAKELNLFFNKYDFKKGCVGSPDTVHLEGEEGLYYLECKDNNCHLTHYNGIEYFKKGSTPLPKCKK